MNLLTKVRRTHSEVGLETFHVARYARRDVSYPKLTIGRTRSVSSVALRTLSDANEMVEFIGTCFMLCLLYNNSGTRAAITCG